MGQVLLSSNIEINSVNLFCILWLYIIYIGSALMKEDILVFDVIYCLDGK